MKKIYTYSENKFKSFSQAKQMSIILEMLEVLEKSWELEEYRKRICESLNECLSFIDGFGFLSEENTNKFASLRDVINTRDVIISQKGLFLKDTDILIKRYDTLPERKHNFPLVLILDNLRSAFNVGAIIRNAECLGVKEIALCEKSPDEKNKKVLETAMGTVDFVSLRKFSTTQTALLYYRDNGYEVIALELTNQSIALKDYQPASKIALIVGNESLGIGEDVLKVCDKIIQIEMWGIKNSLNVSNATAIATYTLISKMEESKYE